MKALSLIQPYASLIAIGAKRIETRSWRTSYRGPLAIHASKRFPREYRGLCIDTPFSDILRRAGIYADELSVMPLGAIVAVAELARVFRAEEIATVNEEYGYGGGRLLPHELEFGDLTPGRFAWVLNDVRRLSDPIPCKGWPGLWNIPEDVARQLEAL